VLEREDATKVVLPEQVDLITIDIGFTRQRQIIPHATSQLGPKGLIVSLIKPQYEVSGRELVKGRLTDALSEEVFHRTVEDLRQLGISVLKSVPSMVRGKDANALEFFVLLRPRGSAG
jgi:23S rRNA (cytidine1920-2'-O)/16S rRNA (cytidine1409-2'-O)-methyltransferase